MRIYFIHVYRRHWEFYPTEPEAAEPDPIDGEESSKGVFHWLQTTASNVWQSIDEAKTGIRGKLREGIELMRRRIDPTEPMLRRMRSAERIEIVYPDTIHERLPRRRLRLLLMRKSASHKRWIVISSLTLPLTIAAVVLPGPNVFLYWNAYRLVSHIFAYRGAQRALNGDVEVFYTPNGELEDAPVPDRRVVERLDDARAASLADRLALPGLVEYLKRTGALPEERGLQD